MSDKLTSWGLSTKQSMHGIFTVPALGILAHLLRMEMEPKYLAEEVIIHPNHHLTR